jgi:Zn-dependent M28 family amino/carboxypeptidase
MPKGAGFNDIRGAQGTDYLTPTQAAQKLGALAVITIPTTDYLSRWAPPRTNRIGGLQIEAPGAQPPAAISNITAGADLAKAIFEGESTSVEDAMKGPEAPEKVFAFAEAKTVGLKIVEIKDTQYTRNVVAIVPGTDKDLKNEYVAFGAHIDHVGMRPTGTGDRIFNGADDDGSGTVAILEIAHAFLTGPRPKRSCLFVWHCGEEKGLWGSAYFTDHPTVDIKQIVTQLNIDMIGRSKAADDTKPANKILTAPDEIYVVGSKKMSTDLLKVSESVNSNYLKIKFNYHYDEPNDPEMIFFRSDHYNYARKGIPIIFYYDGAHEDYHRVGDEVSKIDFNKMTNVTRTVYATGFTLADNKKRPTVDKPLKE